MSSRPAGGHARSVLVLDDDEDLREMLGQALRQFGIADFVGAADVGSMIGLGDRALDCTLAILDVNLGPGQPSGIDAHEWLIGHGFRGRVVFLTGHAKTNTLVQQALQQGSARVFQKPISLGAIRALVEEGAP